MSIKGQAGFTLLEVLLSVTIMAMLVGISMPFYESFVRRNDLALATQTVSALIRRAETYSRSANSDSGWSVEFQSTTATLFLGNNFAGRNTNYDEAVSLPGSVTASGLSEVQFAKLTALPNTTGTVTLSSTLSETRTVTVNAKGMVDY
ncbi:MAG TPA: type II secretion system protein [Candidatus Saccharimonadales bacterium]|nr:type II secretion system protein [Candidatus Saccharimonadales bacterium]